MRFKVEVVAESRVEETHFIQAETPGAAMSEALKIGRKGHPGSSVFVVDVKPSGGDDEPVIERQHC